MSEALALTLVASGSSLAGVVIGGVLSYLVARKQLRASVVGQARRQWVESLQDVVAEICAVQADYAIKVARGEGHDLSSAQRSVYLTRKAALMLSASRPAHDELLDRLNGLHTSAAQGEPIDGFSATSWQLIEATRRVTEAEWERIERSI